LLTMSPFGAGVALTVDSSGNIILAANVSLFTNTGGGITMIGGVLGLGSVANPTELRDINASPGSPTYLLSSTGTGVQWVPAPSIVLPVTTTRTAHQFFTSYDSTTGDFGQTAPVVADLADTPAATYVLAGPTSGPAATATFRALAAGDIPALAYLSSSTQLPVTIAAVTHKWLNSYTSSTGDFTATQPAAADLSDTAT